MLFCDPFRNHPPNREKQTLGFIKMNACSVHDERLLFTGIRADISPPTSKMSAKISIFAGRKG